MRSIRRVVRRGLLVALKKSFTGIAVLALLLQTVVTPIGIGVFSFSASAQAVSEDPGSSDSDDTAVTEDDSEEASEDSEEAEEPAEEEATEPADEADEAVEPANEAVASESDSDEAEGTVEEEAASVQDENSEEAEEEAETWSVDGDKATTNAPVEEGVTYRAPQNDEVTVKFTKLPEEPGTLSIEEITLSDEQVEALGALTDTAYDITSTMENGSFEYELTLPFPKDADEDRVALKYAEDEDGLDDAKTVEEGKVEAKNDSLKAELDHFTIFVVSSVDNSGSCTGAPVVASVGDECYTTLSAAIAAASAGEVVEVHSDLVITSGTNINKPLTIRGVGAPVITTNGSAQLFTITAAGVTIEDLVFNKTDKTSQDLIGVQADNVTISGNTFTGQFVIGDGEVFRALVVSGGADNLLVEGNSFTDLRQPAYVNNDSNGSIVNNFTTGTKGWVVEKASSFSFSGNTWGSNTDGVKPLDIAIIPGSNPGTTPNNYTCQIPAIKFANNNANIEDQAPDTSLCPDPDPTDSHALNISGDLYRDIALDHCDNKSECESRTNEMLSGWEMRLYKEVFGTWALVATDLSDNAGIYKFPTQQEAGVYHVCEVVQPGWTQPIQNWNGSGYLVNTPNLSGVAGEGPYCTTLNYTDTGDRSSKSHFGNVDTTKPVTTLVGPADGGVYNAPFSVDFNSTDGQTGIIQAVANIYQGVSPNGTLVGTCVNQNVSPAAATHDFTCTLNTGSYPDGEYYLKVNAKDAAGWTSNTLVWSFTIDTTPPNVPANLRLHESDGDEVSNPGFTNSYSVTASWDAVGDAHHYEYRYWNSIPGNPYNAPNYYVTAPAGTSQSGVFNQGEGLHHFQVRAIDAAGNASGWSGQFDVTYDETDPVVVFTDPASNGLLANNLLVDVEFSDNFQLSQYGFDVTGPSGSGISFSSRNFQTTDQNVSLDDFDLCAEAYYGTCPSDFPDGVYKVRAKAYDEAGNRNISVSRTIVIDRTGPAAPTITAPAHGAFFNTAPILNQWTPTTDVAGIQTYQVAYIYDDLHTFAGSTCPGEVIDGKNVSGCRDTLATSRNHGPAAWEQGGVTIYVRAIDNLGNIGPWSVPVHYTYDSIAPDVLINSPMGGFVDGIVDIYGSIIDANPHHYYLVIKNAAGVIIGGPGVVNETASLINELLFSWNTTGLVDGDYTILLEARDAANNKDAGSVTSQVVTIDRTAPTVDLVFPTPGPAATSFQAVFSEDVNEVEAENGANYFLNNWPGAGGSGDLAGDVSIDYDPVTHTATVQMTNPGWYVSPEQEWGVQNLHDLAGNLQAVNPYSETSTPMVAPVTTDSGTDTAWHNADVTVTLACDDGDSTVGSGCQTTYYTTDGTDPTTASSQGTSVLVAAEGESTVKYFSVDRAGNTEAVKTAANTVKIDKTAPSVTLSIDPSSPDGENDWYVSDPEVTLSAADSLSGVDRIEYRLNGGAWTLYTAPFTVSDGNWQIEFQSFDVAGNASGIGSHSAKVDTEAPDMVESIDADYDDAAEELELTWQANDSDIHQVHIYRGTSKGFDINSSSHTVTNDDDDEDFTDKQVEEGETYYYKFVSEDEAGNRDEARVISVTIPEEGGGPIPVTDEGTEAVGGGEVQGVQTSALTTDEGTGTDNSVQPQENEEGQVKGAATENGEGGFQNWLKEHPWQSLLWLLILLAIIYGGYRYLAFSRRGA